MAFSADAGDHELIAAAQRGERSALDAFVRRHDRWVRNVVYATVGNSSAVDDIVQHVWTKVWQQIGTLVDPARWRSWLYKMARNAAVDAGLKAARQRRRRVAFEEAGNGLGGSVDPTKALIRAEEYNRALAAIQGLPAIYREPFILRHVEAWSYAQIGEAMSLPVDTVETRLVRARRLLRSALRDWGAERVH
ncbi:MAG: RNA polymerase sigma factor [Phycisphaerae bacterium]|nr:RNA polymerase sigma factor [Phycisphaerae bacterium]